MTTTDITNLVINIAQASSVIISVVFVCITVGISVRDNKKKNYLSVEVSLRMNVLNNLRDSFAELLYLTAPDIVVQSKTIKQKDENLQRLIEVLKKIRVYYKGIHDHDKMILNLLNENTKAARDYFLGNKGIKFADLEFQNLQLEAVTDLCIGAYWGFIKTQSTGDRKGEGDYKKIFEKWHSRIYGQNEKSKK